jgi:hypothetical protein
MNVIQSFWSKPAFHASQRHFNSREFGGWSNVREFAFASALSCLTLRKYNSSVQLYTDSKGAELLIEQFDLPFTNVNLSLDSLEHADHRLWTLGKIKAIADQSEPFVHVDNDIFTWQKFSVSNDDDFIIAQSSSAIWSDYVMSHYEMIQYFKNLPEFYRSPPKWSTRILNVGLIGGNDISFFQEFTRISKELLQNNEQSLELINAGAFNQMLEEYLISCLVEWKSRDVYLLLDHQEPPAGISHLNFNLVPVVHKYIHLIGREKVNVIASKHIELRLEMEFPSYYKKISKLFEDMPSRWVCINDNVRKSLPTLYTSTLSQICSRKLALAEGVEFVTLQGFTSVDKNLAVKVRSSSEQKLFAMPPVAVAYFYLWGRDLGNIPSIDEMWKELSARNSFQTEQQASLEKYNLVNSITMCVFSLGILTLRDNE